MRDSGATVLLVLVGGAFLLGVTILPTWLASRSNEPEARRLLRTRFAQLAIGDTKNRVEVVLGRPETVCTGPDGLYPHQMPGSLVFDKNTVRWRALAARTTERWIYPLPFEEVGSSRTPEPRTHCRPRYAEGEVGFDATGTVLWFIASTDEDYVTYGRDAEPESEGG